MFVGITKFIENEANQTETSEKNIPSEPNRNILDIQTLYKKN